MIGFSAMATSSLEVIFNIQFGRCFPLLNSCPCSRVWPTAFRILRPTSPGGPRSRSLCKPATSHGDYIQPLMDETPLDQWHSSLITVLQPRVLCVLTREGVPIEVLKNEELLTQAEEIYLSTVSSPFPVRSESSAQITGIPTRTELIIYLL